MSSDARIDYFPPSKPWREHDGCVKLVGMKCAHCETAAFPAREVCSVCGRDDAIAEIELAERGVIYTFSEVHVAPKGFATPYVIGYVDMLDGVRVLSQIEGSAATLSIGQDVRVKLGVVRTKADGSTIISYRFSGVLS